MLMKVRHDLLEVGFVKVPRDDKGSIGVFVNVAIEHIMKLGQSQCHESRPGAPPSHYQRSPFPFLLD